MDDSTSTQNGSGDTDKDTKSSTFTASSFYPEISANEALTLATVAGYLLDRQLASQAAAFEKEGGFTEGLYRVRAARRR